MSRRTIAALTLLATAACSHSPRTADEHAGHDMAAGTSSATGSRNMALPADAQGAGPRLTASTRHGEYVMISTGPNASDSVRAWVVYPERNSKAPVVLVIHEILGLSTWVRGIADQLAADGYIAVAPDLLTGRVPANSPDSVNVAAIRSLDSTTVFRQLDAVAAYATSLPAASGKLGTVGFCWGGSYSFSYAAHAGSRVGAAVVYYGSTPSTPYLNIISAPVLGLYGGNDMRVNSTIPRADSVMKAGNKRYEHHEFAGAGHGFLRQQSDSTGANARAAADAWPRTIAWFRTNLGA
jgi:carboxymethylenebutenolidase